MNMPEIYCGKCGTLALPTDLYCRKCSAPLSVEAGVEKSPPLASAASPGSRRIGCLLAAAGLGVMALALTVIVIIALTGRPGGRPAIEIVGTQTPYPTKAPYRTPLPYKTSTPYPTAAFYPTTGPVSTPTATPSTQHHYVPVLPFPDFLGGCELRIKNQNTNLDSILILSTVDTRAIAAAVYVRANDAFTYGDIEVGTYYIFVALGLDWDETAGRFSSYPSYFRFKDANTFSSCTHGYYGGYQYLDITLNYTEGSGSDTLAVLPDSFPDLAH
jgi:hypothetical protein